MMVYSNSENECDVIQKIFHLLINFALSQSYAFSPKYTGSLTLSETMAGPVLGPAEGTGTGIHGPHCPGPAQCESTITLIQCEWRHHSCPGKNLYDYKNIA